MAAPKHRKVRRRGPRIAGMVVLGCDVVLGGLVCLDAMHPGAAPLTITIVRGTTSAIRLVALRYGQYARD